MQACSVAALRPAPLVRSAQRARLSTRSEAAAQAAPPTAAAAAAPSGAGALRLRFGSKNIPHPAKAHYGGEDAYFVSEVGGGAAGIADGVGGWAEAGVNPAEYSRTLMATARQFLEESAEARPASLSSAEWLSMREGAAEFAAAAQRQARASSLASADGQELEGALRPPPPPLASTSGPDSPPTPAAEALDVAHRSTPMPGSATACVVRLDAERGVLDAANLGDSGFMIIRGGQLHFQSPAQQHFFDCPLQFGMPPDTDWAEDAAVYELPVQAGDALVLATDGLLDNLWPADIVRLAPRSAAEVEQAAAAMAEAAAVNAADPAFESPYTREALEEGIDIPIWEKLLSASWKDGKLELGKLRGGKTDDITVVVGYVVPAEAAAEASKAA